MALTPEERDRLAYLEARKKAEPTAMDKAKAFGFGAVKSVAGGLGELEKFGSYTAPEMFGFKQDENRQEVKKALGRETILPTTEDVGQFITKETGYKPTYKTAGYETGGEIAGSLGAAASGLVRGGVKHLVGLPSKTSEMYGKAAEKLGFKLSPSQVRQDIPLPAKGARGFEKENQELANTLASGGTGKTSKEINKPFIDSRLNDIGKEFDKVYKGKTFVLDQQGKDALSNIASFQSELPGPTQLNLIKKVASDMEKTGEIRGEELQTIRNNLAHYARTASDRSDAHQVYELIDQIDASVARNHPEVAQTLNVIRPQYRNSVILRDLYNAGGINQGNISLERLGNMLAGRGRLGKADIDTLGELGKELKLRARWEQEGSKALAGEAVASKLLGAPTDLASSLLGTRTATARKIQSKLGPWAEREATSPALEKAGTLTGVGGALAPFNQ
jgi:hypothetical protein